MDGKSLDELCEVVFDHGAMAMKVKAASILFDAGMKDAGRVVLAIDTATLSRTGDNTVKPSGQTGT